MLARLAATWRPMAQHEHPDSAAVAPQLQSSHLPSTAGLLASPRQPFSSGSSAQRTLMPPRGPSSRPAALASPTSGRTPITWKGRAGVKREGSGGERCLSLPHDMHAG